MLDHLEIRTRKLEETVAFYRTVLAPLGYAIKVDGPARGFGDATRLDIFVAEGEPSSNVHFAFEAKDRGVVDRIYTLARDEGLTLDREPALAPHIHPNYYAGYLRDPDGRLIEFVCHAQAPSNGPGLPTMYNKIAIISIPVRDQAIAKSFYTDILGCTVVQEMPFGTPGTLWIRLALPGADTELVLATWFPQMKPGCIQGLVLITNSITSTHAELKRRGLDITPIKNQPWAKEATFSDPDGNGWVLQQSAS